MNINDLYPERSITTMLLATMLASFIMTIIVAIFALIYTLSVSEKVQLITALVFPIYLLSIFLMCIFFSLVPMVLIGPPVAVFIMKLFEPNSFIRLMIIYSLSMILGVVILCTLLLSLSLEIEYLAVLGAIWGVSAAYVWNKLMLNPSFEYDKECV